MAFGFDPSIILSSAKIHEPTPNETLQTISNFRSQRAQQEHTQATLADLVRKRQQEATLADLYRQNAENPQGLASALMRGGFGQQAFAAQDQVAQLAQQEAQRRKFYQEAQAAERKQMGELFFGVKDQAGWDAALQGVPEHYRSALPPQFNPEVAQRLANLAVPAEKRAQFEATAGEAEARRKWEEEQRRLDRANRTTNASILAGQKVAAAEGDDTRDLRKEVSGRKEIAKYRQASAELASLKELAKRESGASDMALIFAFMKAMDPESVVRESEYAAAAATGTPDERMLGLVSKWYKGGPLTPTLRQKFIQAAEAAQSGHKAAYNSAVKTYRHVAKKRGFDLAEIGLDDDAPSVGPHGPTVTQGGNTYTWNPETGAYE